MAEKRAGRGWFRWLGRPEPLLLVLSAALLAPVWLVRYPPLVDYPNHLARAYILAHLSAPESQFSQSYGSAWGFYPYLAMDLILVALQKLLPVILAGRILLCATLIGVPLATWIFLREANPGDENMAPWSLLITYSPFFIAGFINFQLGIALCFLLWGFWLRYLARPCLVRWCLVVAVSVILYFTHPLGFAVAALTVTTDALLSSQPFRRMVWSLFLFLPGCFFFLLWRFEAAEIARPGEGHSLEFPSFNVKLIGLVEPLRGYSPFLDLLTILVLALSLLYLLLRNPNFRWNKRWLGVGVMLFVVYWSSPDFPGHLLHLRLTPFLFVLLLASIRAGSRARRLVVVASVLFLVRVGNIIYNFRAVQPELSGLAECFAATPEHVRVLPIFRSRHEALLRRYYTHFWAYGVIEREWFSPFLYHAGGVEPQPLRIFEPMYAPRQSAWFDFEEAADWPRVQKEYDYVWAYHAQHFSTALASIGDLVFQNGELQVFRMRR